MNWNDLAIPALNASDAGIKNYKEFKCMDKSIKTIINSSLLKLMLCIDDPGSPNGIIDFTLVGNPEENNDGSHV